METNQEREMANGFSMLMCGRVINSDISEDFTLPDYCPEIRRVLYVKEELPMPAKFMGGSKLDVNGVIDYTLVYVNGDGEVCSAPLSAEYSFSLPIDNANDFELGEGVSIIAHTVAESSNVRVLSPRRLQIRSHLRTSVFAYGKMLCGESLEGLEDPGSIERLVGECECERIFCESSEVITLTDEYTFSGEDTRVALADSSVSIETGRISKDSITVGGEVTLKMLVFGDGESETVTRRLPLEGEIDLGGIEQSDGSSARVNAFITDVALNVEGGRADIEVSLVLEACVCDSKKLVYTKDIYSTEQECEAVTTCYSLPVVLANRSFDFTQNEKISASELNFPEGAQIVHICASGIADGVEAVEEERVLKGVCKYNMICLVGGEYTHVEARVPFSERIDVDGDSEAFDSVVYVSNCKATCDGETLSLSADISVCCTAIGSKSLEVYKEVRFGERREESGNCWTVCYTQASECEELWSIAKHYGVRAENIKGDPKADRFVVIER